MNIQVTKVFANFINKTAKELGFKAEASFVLMTEGMYRAYVANPEDAMWDGRDYDWDKRMYKAIRVDYPDDYYACPRYLTTIELCKEFKRKGVANWNELKEMVRDMVEI